MLRNFGVLKKTCPGCSQKDHPLDMCPTFRYLPEKYNIVLKYLHSPFQSRQNVMRKKKEKSYSALAQSKLIVDRCIRYQKKEEETTYNAYSDEESEMSPRMGEVGNSIIKRYSRQKSSRKEPTIIRSDNIFDQSSIPSETLGLKVPTSINDGMSRLSNMFSSNKNQELHSNKAQEFKVHNDTKSTLLTEPKTDRLEIVPILEKRGSKVVNFELPMTNQLEVLGPQRKSNLLVPGVDFIRDHPIEINLDLFADRLPRESINPLDLECFSGKKVLGDILLFDMDTMASPNNYFIEHNSSSVIDKIKKDSMKRKSKKKSIKN